MNKLYLLLLVLLLCGSSVFAQNNVGIGTNTPDPSAVLDLTATNKGLLVPRMSTAQMIAIPAPVPGLLIFNQDSMEFAYYDGTAASWLYLPDKDWKIVGNTQHSIPASVGIGTNAPLATFHVNGTVRFQGLASNATFNDIIVRDAATGELYWRTLGSDVWDGDNQTLSTGPLPNTLNISGGNAVTVDTDPTNDFNTALNFDPVTGILSVTDANGTLTTNINVLGNIIAGAGLTSIVAAGVMTIDAQAQNGLYVDPVADAIKLGGPLVENTTITNNAFDLNVNLNGNGAFNVQNNGNPLVHVENQAGGRVGIGTNTISSPNALLEMVSANKGILVPEMSSATMYSLPVTAPADLGVMIFNTDRNVHMYWNGTCWLPVGVTICTDFTVDCGTGTGCIYTSSASNQVFDFIVTLGPAPNVAVPVIIATAGIPTGVTVNFSATSVVPTDTVQVTITGSNNAVPGTYNLTFLAMFGPLVSTCNYTLNIYPGGISLGDTAAIVNEIDAYQNSTTDTTLLSIDFSQGGCNTCNNATISFANLPAGVTASASPNTINGGIGSSVLTFTASSAAVVGKYDVIIQINCNGQIIPISYQVIVDTSVINITANVNNYDLYLDAQTPANPITLISNVLPGVIVFSPTTATAAYNTGAFPSGSYILIHVDCGGMILGHGGNGGAGDNNIVVPNCFNIDGTPGGPALEINTTGVVIDVLSSCGGLIGGGGGGGGGGEDMVYSSPALCAGLRTGGGGGGGAGNGLAGLPPGGGCNMNGTAGVITPLPANGLGGNTGCHVHCQFCIPFIGCFTFDGDAGFGGNGGDYGFPGQNGTDSNCNGDVITCGITPGTTGCGPGNGGTAGQAIITNNFAVNIGGTIVTPNTSANPAYITGSATPLYNGAPLSGLAGPVQP